MSIQQKRDKEEHSRVLENIRTVSSTKQGQEFINYVLSLSEIYSSCFTGNSGTFYNEGKRSVGLQLLEAINEADPNIYINILKHNITKENSNA